MKEKFNSIQILRGVAAVSVILFHLINVEKKYSGGDSFMPALFGAGQSGVDLFFVISGFIMATITQDSWGRGNSLKFILKRFSRIYPVYWFYFFVTLSIFFIKPTWVNNSQNNKFDFISSFLLYPTEIAPLVLVAWSLMYEIYFYLIFAILINFKRKFVLISLGIWLFFLVVSNLFIKANPSDIILGFTISPFSIEFILGAFCAVIYKSLRIKLPTFVHVLLILVAVCSVPFFYEASFEYMLPRGIGFGILYSVIIFSSVCIEKESNVTLPKLLITIGDSSYSIYLSHLLILSALGKFWFNFLTNTYTLVDNFLFVTISISTIVIFSYLSSKYIERTSYGFLSKKIDKLFQ